MLLFVNCVNFMTRVECLGPNKEQIMHFYKKVVQSGFVVYNSLDLEPLDLQNRLGLDCVPLVWIVSKDLPFCKLEVDTEWPGLDFDTHA